MSPVASDKGGSLIDQLPTEQLTHELQELAKAAGHRVLQQATGRLGGVAKKLAGTAGETGKAAVEEALKGGGKAGILKGVAGKVAKGAAGKVAQAGKAVPGKIKEAVTGGGGGGGQAGKTKVTNIVETIDVGVPRRVAYDQWTRFTEFPDFMKKVEKVEQESDTELSWRAQIFLSHRDWKSTIIDQVPDERIVWKSEGAKGYVDGAVTFHELTPDLTRILVVLQYYPQGFVEKVANLWRAQGRRVRLELKHFRRHVMTETLLHPEEVKGWRGEIHDSEVTKGPQEEEGPEEGAEAKAGQGEPAEGEQKGEPAEGEKAKDEQEQGQPGEGEEAEAGETQGETEQTGEAEGEAAPGEPGQGEQR
ncbi:MAG: SRPBCC family protein [Micromonosporaceae bacterium]